MTDTNNTDGAALLPVTQADRALGEELAALWAAVTAGDLSTAERHTESELVECPMCREGSIEATDYCNIDSKALGVQFYGIGPEHGAHERLWTAVIANFPAILAALSSPLPATQEDAERSERREGFAPCPTCRQYSHSIDDDALANAFMHFEAMAAHPVRGHPMGHIYDDATRDAAQVLVAAAKGASTPQRQEYDGEVGTALVRNEHRVRGSSAPSYCTPYGTAVKQVGHLRAAIEQALKCSPKIRYLPTVPSATIVYDCGDPWEILRAALAHPAQATSSALSGDAGGKDG